MDGLDAGPIVDVRTMMDAREKIRAALETIATGPLDGGMGCGGADLWAIIDGVEYFIHIQAKRLVSRA